MLLSIGLNGLMIGGLYMIMGLAFSLQWGISGIINLTFGGMVMLGAYVSLALSTMGIVPLISAVPSAILLFFLGIVIYRYLLGPIIKGDFFVTLIMTFAIEMVLENFIMVVWSTNYRRIASPYSDISLQIGPAILPLPKIIIFIVSILLILGIQFFITRTSMGKGILASAQNRFGATVSGINVERMYMINFAIGCALGGISGALLTNITSFSVVTAGTFLGKVFVIAVLGGLGNIWGAAFGGITLALAESYASPLFGSQYCDALGLIVMVLVLIVRPQGLIGKKFW